MTRALALTTAFLLLAAAPAHADEAAAAPQPAPAAAPRSAWIGARGVVHLARGGVLRGTVVSAGPEGDVVRLLDGTDLRLAPGAIAAFEPDPSPHAAGAGAHDPARGRHLATPAALLLRRGELALSLLGLGQPQVAVGILDHLTLQAAAVAPAFGVGGDRVSTLLSARAGGSPARGLHLAGGVQLALEPAGTVAVLSGTATWASPALAATVYAGAPPVSARALGLTGDRVTTAGATLRLRPGLALASELWLGRERAGTRAVAAAGLRLFRRTLALDVGAAAGFGGTGARVVPWLGLSLVDFPATWIGRSP